MYFYLEWISRRPSKILITDERPKNINYETIFKIDKGEIILCGNISEKFTNYETGPIVYSKNQYLLSHLQKCVRRMKTLKCVQTAKHLIDVDVTSLLRRLPIIMLEDVTIHESISIIIWLMIADSKKYILKNEMVQWILGVVYYLSKEPTKTEYKNNVNIEYEWEPKKYSEEDNTILYSLKFRKRYGGMKGDMYMIEDYKKKIIHNDTKIMRHKIPIIQISNVLRMEFHEWIYQANDFHCNRSIPRQIMKYYPMYDEQYIKELLWKYSSCKNNRVKHNVGMNKDWEKIKEGVKKVQKSCIYY